mmetsp:Transcript_5908/g.15693  ORF Transcript_5908/g.15693 Transcript_5908/m.15693 type:complete len:233 (-) Transcript_5908:257-955(-)
MRIRQRGVVRGTDMVVVLDRMVLIGAESARMDVSAPLSLSGRVARVEDAAVDGKAPAEIEKLRILLDIVFDIADANRRMNLWRSDVALTCGASAVFAHDIALRDAVDACHLREAEDGLAIVENAALLEVRIVRACGDTSTEAALTVNDAQSLDHNSNSNGELRTTSPRRARAAGGPERHGLCDGAADVEKRELDALAAYSWVLLIDHESCSGRWTRTVLNADNNMFAAGTPA